jgi:hypothetical protein
METFPEQGFSGQNMFQGLAMNDFSMDGLWNLSPERVWNDQAMANLESEGDL